MGITKSRANRDHLTTSFALTTALALALAPAPARPLAPEPTTTAADPTDATGGLTGSLELGFSQGIGDVSGAQGDTLRATFGDKGQLRLLGELGTRISPSVRAGGYLGVDWGGAGARYASCTAASRIDCSAVTARLGLSLQWRSSTARLQPWLGYGAGVLVTVVGDSRHGTHFSETLYGVEVARASVGLDYVLRRDLVIGPYVGYSLGLYLRRSVDGSRPAAQAGDLSDPSAHGWVSSGLRVSWL